MPNRALVVDANILIRGVLGQRVRRILSEYADSIIFFVPADALAEAEEHLVTLVEKRGADPARALILLRSLTALGSVVSGEVCGWRVRGLSWLRDACLSASY